MSSKQRESRQASESNATDLIESNTILVVADISLVTLIPAKLKNAIDTIVPNMATKISELLPGIQSYICNMYTLGT